MSIKSPSSRKLHTQTRPSRSSASLLSRRSVSPASAYHVHPPASYTTSCPARPSQSKRTHRQCNVLGYIVEGIVREARMWQGTGYRANPVPARFATSGIVREPIRLCRSWGQPPASALVRDSCGGRIDLRSCGDPIAIRRVENWRPFWIRAHDGICLLW
jgi:hypothetical protein